MPRKPFINSNEHPYHITIKTVDEKPFPLPISDVWNIFENYLYLISHLYEIKIFSFVLMSNHIHLITLAPLGNISSAMNYLFREVSRTINFDLDRRMQVFGNRYYRSLILDDRYLQHAYKYVYRNPVRAGICRKVELYKFSTLSGLLGKTHLLIPTFDPFLFDSEIDQLLWLNLLTSKEADEWVQKALKKRTYKYPRLKSGMQNPLYAKRY